MRRTLFAMLAFGSIAHIGATGPAGAQDFPAKPIRLVVPFSPGGGVDIIARTVFQKLGEELGSPVVIENRGGASGTIGTAVVAKAPADGYTLGLVSSSHASNPSLYKSLPYDTLRDLASVTMLATSPGVLVVHPSLPARTVKELIALAKSKPGALTYASGGSGTSPHLAAELFKMTATLDIVHIPYKGIAPAFPDLMSGLVTMSFPPIPPAMPHMQSGRLRPLGVTSRQRSRIAPELPTIAESGVAGYDASTWYGIIAPAGTPAVVIAKLQSEIAKVMQLAGIRDRLLSLGFDSVASTPQEFEAMIKSEILKWRKVAQAMKLRAE